MKRILLIILVICLMVVFLSSGYCALGKWKQIKTLHFVIYFQETPPGFIDKVKERAEDYYREINFNMGFSRYEYWTWDERCKIYIYSSKEDYVEYTGQPNWSAGCADYKERSIKSYPLASGFIDTLLPHEMGHLIFRDFVGHSNTVPLWLDEGVATYQELARRWGSKRTVLNSVKNNTFMTVEELTNIDTRKLKSRTQIELFYAESSNLVSFLIERYGKAKFRYFCEDLGKRYSLEKAIANNYPFRDLNELNSTWLRYLK
ncbi:MAG: peptidase MA family metallohydrolase [Candidatus Gygaella obscura]|nr:peptidase MA family metallohydrolase [Candidatus Gygaella obscura]